MVKLSITLPEEMHSVIQSSVASGAYASTSEVMRDAMRVWMRQQQDDEAVIAEVKARLQRSAADPRPSLSSQQVRDTMQARRAKAAD